MDRYIDDSNFISRGDHWKLDTKIEDNEKKKTTSKTGLRKSSSSKALHNNI